MYISAINPLNSYKTITNKLDASKSQFTPVQGCDVVSFGSFYGKKFEEVLYRAIGKSELDELFKPKGRIGGHKYTTGNPMGWGAKNWDAGFKYGYKDYYFVQFKKNHFDLMDVYDASDYAEDSRFVITKGYSLDDIDVIREGTNAHGKIIWASSDDVIKEDTQTKVMSIFRLLKQLMTTKDEISQNQAIIEISSYVKEFPQLIKPLLPLAEKDNEFGRKLLFVINKSEDKSYLNFVKSYLKRFTEFPEKMQIHDSSLFYIARHGSSKDLDLVLDVMKKDKGITHHSYGMALSKLMTEKDIPKIMKLLEDSDYNTQNVIVNCFNYREDKKTALEVARKILARYSSLESKVFKDDDELKTLISSCSDVMTKWATADDIPYMKPYTNLGIYTDIDFQAIIKDLEI